MSAINDQGTGQPSNVVQATVSMQPLTAPEAPTNLMALPSDGIATIELSWTEPVNTGGSPITGYNIQSSPTGTDTWTDVAANTGSVATVYSHASLIPGEIIYYRVSAINDQDTGQPSNVVQATVWMASITAPEAPTNLSAASSLGTTTIELSWNEPVNTGGSPITGYNIQSSTNGTDPWTNVETDTGTTTTTYSHNDLTAGETIHYRISAIN